MYTNLFSKMILSITCKCVSVYVSVCDQSIVSRTRVDEELPNGIIIMICRFVEQITNARCDGYQ